MERQSSANADIQAFIVQSTTFPSGVLAGTSPYVMSPAAAAQLLNRSAAQQRAQTPIEPRYHACATTECLLMGANYNPNNPQNRAELERRQGALMAAGVILSGPALVAAASTPQGQVALQALLWNKASATGAAAGGLANAGVQYATTGEVQPGGVVLATVTGGVGAGAVSTLNTARNLGPLAAQTAGLTAVVGINAVGAGATGGEQGATAVGSVAGYGVGQLPIPGAPLLGAFTQEIMTYWATSLSSSTELNSKDVQQKQESR